jgi:hypothetical protein
LIDINDNGSDDKRRFQQLVARENSTLVMSTVASSLSLALFVGLVTYEANKPVRDALFLSGLLFVVCGYFYRELTIHIKDIEDSKTLSLLTTAKDDWSKMKNRGKFWVTFRMGLIRFFFLIPIIAYITYGCPTVPLLLSVLLIIIVALLCSVAEIARVYDP